MSAFVNCLNPIALEKLNNLMVEYPDLMNTCKVEMDRRVVHSDQGILYNYATETLVDHGFDVMEIQSHLPVYFWYAEDDEDCPPSHGMWIANKNTDSNCHFTNVSSRSFNKYGHTGTAFVNPDAFLKAFYDHVNEWNDQQNKYLSTFSEYHYLRLFTSCRNRLFDVKIKIKSVFYFNIMIGSELLKCSCFTYKVMEYMVFHRITIPASGTTWVDTSSPFQ